MSEQTHVPWNVKVICVCFFTHRPTPLVGHHCPPSPSPELSSAGMAPLELDWTYGEIILNLELDWTCSEIILNLELDWTVQRNYTELGLKEPVFCSFLDCRHAAASPHKLEIRTKLVSERTWAEDLKHLIFVRTRRMECIHGLCR